MRILFLTKKLPFPARDGEAIASSSLIRHLAALNHEVTVISVVTPKHNYTLQDIPPDLFASIDFRLVKIDTDIRILKLTTNLFSKMPFHISRFIQNEFRAELISLLNTRKFDIVQFEGLFLLPYLNLIRSKSDAKVIYRSHNVEGIIWQRIAATFNNPIKKWYLTLQAKRLIKYEKKMLFQVDSIVPISTLDEKYYKKEAPQKIIECIPTGIEMGVKSNGILNYKSIYFLGALDWLPNQQGLLWFLENVLPLVKNKIPDLEMHIAGRNAPVWLADKLQSFGKFYGEINNKSIFLLDKFISIVPLFAGSGLKIKIIESMAEGKVIVTTPVGAEGMPLNLEDYMFISTDAHSMADLIISIIESPEDALKKSRIGQELIQSDLLNQQLTRKLVDIYQLLLK